MNRTALSQELQSLSRAVPGFVVDDRKLKSPQARLNAWRLAFEHGNAFETVALQWLGSGEPPAIQIAHWKLCPPAERARGWDYRADLPAGGIAQFLTELREDPPAIDKSLEEDEVGLTLEGLARLRMHKQIERRPQLARRAKDHHGYECQACSFNFLKRYGELGRQYIEAHHLHPLASRLGESMPTDPKKDFAVLCANCHRMIHKSEHVSDVTAFKTAHVRATDT